MAWLMSFVVRRAWWFAAVMLAGCGGPSEESMIVPAAPPTDLSRQPAAESTAEVGIELVNHDELMDRIAAAKGRVVVLDCWSTSCPPCVKEFPGLLELQRTHADQIVCLSLSLDYEGIGAVEDVLPRVRGFLQEVGSTIPNMLSTEESDTMLVKLDLVSVPGIFVYSADGKLAKRFDDDMATSELGRPFTYDDVAAIVGELIGK